jgi:copper homeostasis protein
MNFKLEVCAGSLTSALNAQLGGAHRIELCNNLNEGGTTPSHATILLAKKHLHIPVFVLIRPRAGDFLYSAVEFESMKEDILYCKECGVEGVVFGILRNDGTLDTDRCAQLTELARPMQVTFHRAFDMASDPFRALQDIISLGIERVLTSGQAASAIAGADHIAEFIIKAGNRIVIMPGGGITEDNVADVLNMTGAGEVHASLRSPVLSEMQYRNKMTSMGKPSLDEYSWMETDAERVKRLLNALMPEKQNHLS